MKHRPNQFHCNLPSGFRLCRQISFKEPDAALFDKPVSPTKPLTSFSVLAIISSQRSRARRNQQNEEKRKIASSGALGDCKWYQREAKPASWASLGFMFGLTWRNLEPVCDHLGTPLSSSWNLSESVMGPSGSSWSRVSFWASLGLSATAISRCSWPHVTRPSTKQPKANETQPGPR